MGCHFFAPFAIIFMHEIESRALQKLKAKPVLYQRYIDDIILGPLTFDEEAFENILNAFNSINPQIKFTLEKHQPEDWLNFLDLKIKIVNGNIKYC